MNPIVKTSKERLFTRTPGDNKINLAKKAPGTMEYITVTSADQQAFCFEVISPCVPCIKNAPIFQVLKEAEIDSCSMSPIVPYTEVSKRTGLIASDLHHTATTFRATHDTTVSAMYKTNLQPSSP